MNLDAKTYFDLLKEQTRAGHEVSMILTGNSMAPFLLHSRDTIYFSKPSRPLRRGDMVFFQRADGQYVMHRILKIKGEDCYLIGDNQTRIEGPVSKSQIFAIVTKVKRKDRIIGPHSFWWFFFAHIWTHLIPCRHALIRGYQRLQKLFR